MDEPPTDPDATGPDTPGGEHRMPGWVKGFVILGLIAVVVVLVALLLGRGEHGPGRHLPADQRTEVDSPERHTPPADMDHG